MPSPPMLIPPPPVMSGGSRTTMYAVRDIIGALAFRVTLGCLGVLAFGPAFFRHSPNSAAVRSSNMTRKTTDADAVSTLKGAAAHLDV